MVASLTRAPELLRRDHGDDDSSEHNSPHSTAPPTSSSAATTGQNEGTQAGISQSGNPTTQSSGNSNSGPSGLSTGAKAGIGVGVAVFALIIIGILIWVVFSRRKRRKGFGWGPPQDQYAEKPGYSSDQKPDPDASGSQASAHHGPQEMEQPKHTHEMEAGPPPAELDADGQNK